MSRRLLTVEENGRIPQIACVEGEITRQKGGGRRHYEGDNYVWQYSNCRGKNKHFATDERDYSTNPSSRYANNSDSTDGETESDSEITVTTSSSKDRQRKRKNCRRIRTPNDSVYKADDECDYKRRRNGVDTKNCMRITREHPPAAINAQGPRPTADGPSGNYLEQTANHPGIQNTPPNAATINENPCATKAMLRFMDKLFRTLGDVTDGTTTNSIAPTREAYAPKVPAIIENTSITNEDEPKVRDIPPNTPHYEQNYAHFGMKLPQQIVYQTHITHVPTQNTRYPSFNKNCICSQNTEAEKTSGKCMQQGEYRQIPQLAPTATQPQALAPTVATSPTPQLPAQAQEKVQNAQFTTQRYSFPQYPCVAYSQPTPMPLRSGMPQEYMPGASRQPVACTPPPTGAAIHASIRTLPKGIYKSHVEEYVLSRTPQGPTLQKTMPTVESLEQSNMRAETPTQFSQQFTVTQQPIQPISVEGRKQNTEFSLLRNSREQTHQTRQPASASNQYVTVNDGINISGTAKNINELRYLETQQTSKQYLTSNGQIADATPSRTQKAENVYSLGNESLQQTNLPNQKLDLSTDAINNPTMDTYYKGLRQFAGVENSVEETENYNVINNDGLKESNGKSSDLIDVEIKANESRTIEHEEVKHSNSQNLVDEANHGNQKGEQIKEGGSRKSEKASRKSKKGGPMRTNREEKSGEVAANKKSKPNRESKYSNKKENTPEMNEEFSTDKEMQRQTSSGSCNSDYLRECLRKKRDKNKNKRKKRHCDSFSDSDCDETSNGYSEYSSYNERDMRRKRHGKYEHTDSGSDDDMQYSLSRTSCKELKKCCSRIVAICRMARDTAGTQTEQCEDSTSLQLQRSNKLVDGLPKSLADGLAATNPRVVKQIMQLNRDRRKCRVCACDLMDETGTPVVNDDVYLLKFDNNEPKLPSRMCMERKSRCKCNCGSKLSDTESEIIREIIRKKRLQEKSKRINALRQNKYDSCDYHSACDFVDEEDEGEFIANLLRKHRRNRDRERDRTQAQNMYENCVCDCASKAKELATEIMHEMVKSHIQKIVTDELQNRTHSYENRKGVCTCNFAERPTVRPKTEGIKQPAGVCSCDAGKSSTSTPKCRRTGPQTFECTCEPDDIPTVGSETERVQPQAGVCTCDYDENPTVRSKVERMQPQPGVCTCDSNENPTVRLKGERMKPQSGVCSCDLDEVAGKSSTWTPKCRKTGPQTFECTCEPDEIPTVRPKTGRVHPQAGVCSCDSDEARTVRHKSGRSKAQMFECTCETDDSSASAPKSERVAPRTSVCTCESDEIPISVPKSERTKLRNFECICDPIESRTVTQTFTRTIELQSGGPTNNEISSPKRYSNGSPEPTKNKRKSTKKQSRNSKSSKSAEDNENEYITLMQNSMATERKGDKSWKDAVSKSEQGSRRNSVEAQQGNYSDKNTADPQINNSTSSEERLSIRIRKDKTNQKETTKKNEEEYVPASYYEDRIEARRKITVKSYQAGPPKLARDELKRCRDDCACKERATQPKAFKTTKETCRADGCCKQAIEPAFNDIEEYALSNARNMARTMVPKSNNSYEANSLKAASGHGSIKKMNANTKASKKEHASGTVTGYPQSNKNAERNTQANFLREAQGSDSDMLLEQRAAICAELTMNELLPQHSLRTLLTKLSSPDGKLYAADEFIAQPEEILRLAKINQSKMLTMPSSGKCKLGPTTVMAQSLHMTGKQSKSEIEPAVKPSQLVSGNGQLKSPNSTPSLSESCGLSAVESALQQQQHDKPHVTNRLHELNNKFARKSRIPLPVNSSTYRAEKQKKSISKSSSAEKRANQRPLIEQKSDSNHQITRLWPEQAAIAAQRLKQEKTANDSNELGAKQLKKSQSNIELSCVLNYSPTRPRLESGRQEELPKLSSQESQMSAVSQRKAENTKESFGSSNPENMQLKMLNILSAVNQSAASSSGLSSESCKTDGLQTQNEQRCARCRAFYKKTGAHRNIKELQADANGRLNYEPQPRLSPAFIPATIHATPKHCRAERFSITDDEQSDSDIECITVEYGGSEGDSYTQYQDELLRKQQLWRKGTVRQALEVEEKAERAKNLQRTTLTGECLERAIHYPTRVWNEERKQLNLQRNGAGIFWPL